ncbi:hypothetical protein ABC347_07120 [Sphingomonas sp. 1P06PA]|uniref:hypothetical protein n=1 Tax=Sphingomonas sp. 1P06PA TaxID=554121 RepID=UPI0039A71625
MDSKSFASLSSGLLARKGQAKPAMRPQVFNPHAPLEDLGWNDMGHSVAASANPVIPPQAPPAVVRQQEELAREIAAPVATVEPAAVTVPPAPITPPLTAEAVVPVSRVRGAKARSAFTLRLDPERHLKLRLACAVDHRSAQMIVTEALDAFLATMPELTAIAGKLPAKAAQR